MNILKRLFGATPAPVASSQPSAPPSRPLTVSREAVAHSRMGRAPKPVNPFAPAVFPKGIAPEGMAMDDALSTQMGWTSGGYASGLMGEGLFFLGYPYLSELAQRPEYRRISEVIATEMTRKWIRVTAAGDEDKTDRISVINDALDRLNVRDKFREIAEQDGFFGRAHLYVDLGKTEDPIEIKTSIGGGRDNSSKAKISKGDLKGFRTVEAVWCYPTAYNSTNPLDADWYAPQSWNVQGKVVHASRLLTFVGREVPDLLKPAYAFGGLSMSQMAKPYVDNWLRTRQGVADLINSFSVSGVKVDMASALAADGGDGLMRRIDLFTNLRQNLNTMVLNKATGDQPAEEFFNVSTPLGTLDHLQAQSQEHMAAVSGIPLVKLLGITPSGLNASSDGELRTFYDMIHAYQEKFFGRHLRTVLDLVQLSEFGDIDEDIHFTFEPLWSMSEVDAASVRLTEAQTDAVLAEASIILPEEARKRIATDPDTVYQGLDLSLDIAPDPTELMGEPPEPETDVEPAPAV